MADKSRKQQLEELLALDPGDPFLRYGLGMEHVSAGDDAEAVACFGKLLALSADYVPAYLQLGQALVRLGRTAEARAAWQQGITRAQAKREDHAAQEMQAMLEGLE